MSRVLLLSLGESEVVSRCTAAKVGISAIEGLPGGGTRLVCMSAVGAETLRKKFKKSQMLTADMERAPYRPNCKPL